jgi:hypothetical protein
MMLSENERSDYRTVGKGKWGMNPPACDTTEPEWLHW